MRRLPLLSIALALLAVAMPAMAQNRPPVPGTTRGGTKSGGSKSGDRPRIRFGDDPEPESEQPKRPEPEAEKQKSEIDVLLEELATWPSADARQASIRLAARPQVATLRLLGVLDDPSANWRSVCGAASTLGRMGDTRSLEPIQAKLQDRKLYQHSGDLLDALARIDPIGAKARLLAQLLHSSSAVVVEARKRLEPRVGAGDLDALRDIFEIGGSAARLNALQLMGVADAGGARADLAKALRDDAPRICIAAARALAASDDPEALEALRQASRSPLDRQMAYGYLGLGIAGDASGRNLLDGADVRALLGGRGLDHVERLNRAVAAIVLADLGYYHEVEELETPLDRKIVPRLLEIWINPEYWKDMKVVRPLVLLRLRRLTGRYALREPLEWRSWWEENRSIFRARRVLARVTPASLPTMVVTVAGDAAPGGETTVMGSSALELGPPLLGELAILLPPKRLQALADVINGAGVLKLGEGSARTYSTRGMVEITVRAGNRDKRFSVEPERASEGAKTLLAAVAEVRAQFAWQRYRTLDRTLDFESFVRATAPLFAPERTQESRDATLTALIVDALDPKRGDVWLVASLQDLQTIADVGAYVDDARADRMLQLLGQRESADEVAVELLRVLASLQRPEAQPILLDFITERGERAKDRLLEQVFDRVPDSLVAEGLADERPIVRVAALRTLTTKSLGGDGAVAARAAIGDEDRHVRSAAIRAIGRLHDEESRAVLDKLASESGELRIPAIEALGLLGGKRSLAILMTAFTSDDPALRVASIQAFGDCGEPEGYSAIVFASTGDPSGLVREVAAKTILRVGSRRAGDELRKLAIDPAMPAGPRARALSGLALLRGKEVANDLHRLVKDASDIVADEAALSLARWRDPAGVEQLIDMLESNRRLRRARRALEAVSLESFVQDDSETLAALYGGWWELTAERGPRGWLVDALRLGGIEDDGLDEWAAGRAGREVAPMMMRGLRVERWFVRRACDLALRDMLGRNVGDQESYTTSGDVERMASAWEKIWAEIIGK